MASGAEIIIINDRVVVKTGEGEVGKRVSAQGVSIKALGSPLVPFVYAAWSNGYAMERLVETRIDPVGVCGLLRRSYWKHPPYSAWDPEQTLALMMHLSIYLDLEILEAWAVLHSEVTATAGNLTACLTHGDPTLENVMQRPGDCQVLIDPIPARAAVPDLLSVDLGKILQSCAGYDDIVRKQPVRDFDDSFLDCFPIDRTAARYWAVVHYARAMPYLPEELRPEMLEVVRARLLCV